MKPREVRRMMQRMGVNMTPIEGVKKVILELENKKMIIESPEVAVLEVMGQKIYQITGGSVKEEKIERELVIPEEDVQLVAQQANVSLEEARAALEQTGGDLAQAILLLTSK